MQNLNYSIQEIQRNVYRFESVGPKGTVSKIIKFTLMHRPELYNLAFGDEEGRFGDINDLVVTDNKDSRKVLSTVSAIVFSFTETRKNAWVFAKGSTSARTRMYRIGISNNLRIIKEHFLVYGIKDNQWFEFKPDTEYEAFLIKRK